MNNILKISFLILIVLSNNLQAQITKEILHNAISKVYALEEPAASSSPSSSSAGQAASAAAAAAAQSDEEEEPVAASSSSSSSSSAGQASSAAAAAAAQSGAAATLIDYKLYGSILLGAFAIDTSLVENIRFSGNYQPNYENGERKYGKDSSDDPHWNLTKLLFPSANGTFNIGSHFQDNLSYMLNGMTPENKIAALARIMAHIADPVAKPGSLADDMIQKLKSSHRKKINKAKNKKQKTVFDFLTEALDAAIEAEKKPGSFYPLGTAEQIFMAFVMMHFNTLEELESFMEKVTQTLSHTDRIMLKGYGQADDLIKTYQVYYKDIYSQPVPYTFGNGLPSNGLAISPSGKGYADCVETAIRQFLNIALFNPETKTFELSQALSNNESLNHFFTIQTPGRASDGSTPIRTEFSNVVSALNEETQAAASESVAAPPSGSNKIVYVQGNFEVDTGHWNFLKVLSKITELPLPNIKSDEISPELVFEWYKKILEKLNTNYDFTVESVSDKTLKKRRYGDRDVDIFGDVKISFIPKGQGKTGFSFIVHMESGHGEIQSLTALGEGEEKTLSETSFLNRLNGAALSAYNLSTYAALDALPLPADYPILHSIFPKALTSNTALIESISACLKAFNKTEFDFSHMISVISDQISLSDEHTRNKFITDVTAVVKDIIYSYVDDSLSTDVHAIIPPHEMERLLSLIPALSLKESLLTTLILPQMPQLTNLRVIEIKGEQETKELTFNAPHLKQIRILNTNIEEVQGLENSHEIEKIWIQDNPNLLGKRIKISPYIPEEGIGYDRGIRIANQQTGSGELVEKENHILRLLDTLQSKFGDSAAATASSSSSSSSSSASSAEQVAGAAAAAQSVEEEETAAALSLLSSSSSSSSSSSTLRPESVWTYWRIASVTHFIGKMRRHIEDYVSRGGTFNEEFYNYLAERYMAEGYKPYSGTLPSDSNGILVLGSERLTIPRGSSHPDPLHSWLRSNPNQKTLIYLKTIEIDNKFCIERPPYVNRSFNKIFDMLAIVSQAENKLTPRPDTSGFSDSFLTAGLLDLSGLSNLRDIDLLAFLKAFKGKSVDLSGFTNPVKIYGNFLVGALHLESIIGGKLSVKPAEDGDYGEFMGQAGYNQQGSRTFKARPISIYLENNPTFKGRAGIWQNLARLSSYPPKLVIKRGYPRGYISDPIPLDSTSSNKGCGMQGAVKCCTVC